MITNQYSNVYSVECLKYSVLSYQHLQAFNNGCCIIMVVYCTHLRNYVGIWNIWLLSDVQIQRNEICVQMYNVKLLNDCMLWERNTNNFFWTYKYIFALLIYISFSCLFIFLKSNFCLLIQHLVCGKAMSVHTLLNKFVILKSKFCFQLIEKF